ncbi:AMP-dependent synthetase/ligase [Dictyobacter halimunensis]
MHTIPRLFMRSVDRFGARPALLEPRSDNAVTTLTYNGLRERVLQFAGYLQQQNVSKGQRVMIWSASCSNWLVAYFASLLLGLVVVPLDVNTKEDFLQRLLEITDATFLITTQKNYTSLKSFSLPFIDIDALPTAELTTAQLPEVEESDLAELVFTSGTTGQPKGVMLSHKNIVSNAIASLEVVKITSADRALSILPLSHMFEMTIEMALIYAGASIVYARSLVPDTLFRLLATQHVTCMVLVPQALQLFMNGIEREVRRQKLEKQWKNLHKIARWTPFPWRRHLFRSVHRRFGGHFRLFVSGGAYLAPMLGRAWEEMGFRILQGYGATECSPVISVNPLHDHTLESVGQPLPGVTLRIEADGEIQVQGPNVAMGYWQNEEATATAFHDGWYATGDLGYMDKHHNLYLKGRKKNLIVLANGMNVYPEDIENVLQTQNGVKDAVVLGLHEKDQGPTVHAVLLMEDKSLAKTTIQSTNKQLAPHQQVKGFTIWSEQDFPRTHTLKVKRQEVLETLSQSRQ